MQVMKMSDLPAGWSSAKLPELIGTDGLFADGDWVESKDQDPNGEVRLIQLADIGVGSFLNRSARFLTNEKAGELGCTFLKVGDVLISRMADPLGRACIFPGDAKPAVTVVDACIVRCGNDSVSPTWLMHCLNSAKIRKEMEARAGGTTRQRVSRSNLAEIELPIPPVVEQRRIVAKLEELLARSKKAKESLDRIPPLLEKLRKSILAAAFRGDLTKDWREAHPAVEPAEELLARIRAERRKRWEEEMREKGKDPRKLTYEEPAQVDTEGLPDLPRAWCWICLGEVAFSVKDGPHFSPKYVEDGIPFISARNIRPEGIDFTTAK